MVRSDDDTWDLGSSVGATATMVAAGRALATKDPRALIDDPFAEPLVEAVGLDFFTKLVRGELDISVMDAQSRAWMKLMVDGTALRTRYFDTYFLDAAATGVRQVVILASGLDARAYRLAWPPGTVVYEVDQPQVIEFKTAALGRIVAKPTAERRTVSVDLRGDWPGALRVAGLNAGAPTAWSAEGLLMYLPADVQDRLFGNITGLSAAGSTIAADYVTGSKSFDEGGTRAVSESWRERCFGLDLQSLMFTGEHRHLAEYLTALGWRINSVAADDLFTRHDIERTRVGDGDPFDNVVYASGRYTGAEPVVP